MLFIVLPLRYKWHQRQVSSALDRNCEAALLLVAQASLADWLNLPVHIYKSLQSLDVFVVKHRWGTTFLSFIHLFYSNSYSLEITKRESRSGQLACRRSHQQQAVIAQLMIAEQHRPNPHHDRR